MARARSRAYPGEVLRTLALVPPIGLLAVTAACPVSQGRSCDVKASGISMAATVTDDDEGVEVEVELEAGDMSGVGTSLQLCEGEGESLKVNGAALMLTETYAGNFKYRGGFDTPQELYTFELEIGSDKQRISADLVPPSGFAVDAPAPGAELPRAQDAELLWSPPAPGEQIVIELIDDELLCLEDWDVETDDDGSHLIPAGTIVRTDPDTPDGACQAEYVFMRRSTGEYPPGLSAGGGLEAFVRRGVRFASVL